MRVASITEAKNRLSELIDYVRSGESVVITDRGVPVARLESALAGDSDELDAHLAHLERAGLVRRGTGKVSEQILRERPPRLPGGVSVLEALLEERREGR